MKPVTKSKLLVSWGSTRSSSELPKRYAMSLFCFGQVSILRPRANNAMKYLLCETIFAPSGNRNRGTSLEGKYVTTTPKVLWRPVEAFNPLDRSFPDTVS
jgi:hypothetical protein